MAKHFLHIEFFLGCDLASLWELTNAKYEYASAFTYILNRWKTQDPTSQFCLWCDSPKNKRMLFDEWFGKVRTVLTSYFEIPASHIIYCSLHAKLRSICLLRYCFDHQFRIVGKLVKLGAQIAHDSQFKTVEGFIEAVRNAGVKNFDATIPKGAEKVKTPGLTGPKCDKILKAAESIVASFESEDKIEETTQIWKLCQEILQELEKETVAASNLCEFEEKLKKFGRLYVKRFGEEEVTPYIHIVVCHTISILEKHSSIGFFSQQGFESTHKWHKMIFYFSSSHDGKVGRNYLHRITSSIDQILTKIYRVHLLKMDKDVLTLLTTV